MKENKPKAQAFLITTSTEDPESFTLNRVCNLVNLESYSFLFSSGILLDLILAPVSGDLGPDPRGDGEPGGCPGGGPAAGPGAGEYWPLIGPR